MGGLYGQIMVAAGEAVTGNKYAGFRFGYAGGPVNIAVAYAKTYKNDNAPSGPLSPVSISVTSRSARNPSRTAPKDACPS